jgi:hypothetical protein
MIGVLTGPRHCHMQDLSTLDVSKLTPLSPEVISRQATINIGACTGSSSHGQQRPQHFASSSTGMDDAVCSNSGSGAAGLKMRDDSALHFAFQGR